MKIKNVPAGQKPENPVMALYVVDDLLDRVWSKESENSPDTVRVHITKIRSKIDSDGQPSLIRTIHRVGYKLEPPAEDDM